MGGRNISGVGEGRNAKGALGCAQEKEKEREEETILRGGRRAECRCISEAESKGCVGPDKERCSSPKRGPGGEDQRSRGSRGAGSRSGRRSGPGEAALHRRPPYQAAQIILLRLDGERGGPGQRPASEIHAAAQMEVLGSADRGWRGQGASVGDLGHGSGRSVAPRSASTQTLHRQTSTASWRTEGSLERRRRGARREREAPSLRGA